jgi:hypothetical protein
MLNRAGAGPAGRMGIPLRKVAVVGRGGIGPLPPISQRPEVGCPPSRGEGRLPFEEVFVRRPERGPTRDPPDRSPPPEGIMPGSPHPKAQGVDDGGFDGLVLMNVRDSAGCNNHFAQSPMSGSVPD